MWIHFGNKRVVAKPVHIVYHRLHRVGNGKPFNELARPGSGALADISEAVRCQVGSLKAVIEQTADNLISKELHPAVGVVDDEKLTRAQQFVADYQRPDRVVAGAPPGVADHVRIPFGKPGKFRRVHARIHAGENGKSPRRRKRKLALLPEPTTVLPIRLQHFIDNTAHFFIAPFVLRISVRCGTANLNLSAFLSRKDLRKPQGALQIPRLRSPGFPVETRGFDGLMRLSVRGDLTASSARLQIRVGMTRGEWFRLR